MKKVLLLLGAVVLSTGFGFAQSHDGQNHDGHNHDAKAHVSAPVSVGTATTTQVVAQPSSGNAGQTSTLTVENIVFESEVHDFGTVPEGPNADYEFVFKNTGKEPINLQTVNASCGCTTPSWSKEPVLPGKTGSIKASYATKGRPGGFTKSITVVSNAGTKVLTIKGTVEPAPTGSAPTSNKSMIQK